MLNFNATPFFGKTGNRFGQDGVNVAEAVFTAFPACVSRSGIPVASEEPPQGTPRFGAPGGGRRKETKWRSLTYL